MNSSASKEDFDYLYKAVLTLQNKTEAKEFFETLCTPLEISNISQRLHVARMLEDKEVYQRIVSKTGASTATISRVKRSMDGSETYERLFERLK
jgi:TrpR-related protein YerC/YecD